MAVLNRRLVAAVIVVVGLGASLAIFIAAAPAPADPPGYAPEDSKQYLRDMELYGGKANVLASDFRQWLESLLHGRRLAGTVASLTLVLLLFYLVASTPLPERTDRPKRPDGETGPPEP